VKLLVVTQKVDRDDSILGFFWSWLAQFGHTFEKVTVICLERGFSADSLFPAGNIKVLSLGKEEGVSRLTYVMRFWKYIRESRSDYDCVFVHMNPEYVLLGGLFWRWWDKKIILWYTHGTVTIKLKIAVLLSSVTFTATPKSCRVRSKKVRVVGHGIDTEYFREHVRGVSENMKLVTVGRISPVKDYETIVRALGRVKKAGLRFTFTAVGGPGMSSDSAYIEKLKFLIELTRAPAAAKLVTLLRELLTVYDELDRATLPELPLELALIKLFGLESNP